MGSGKYDCYFKHDPAEVSKCLLCYDPECSKACPQSADIGGIIRSLYLQDYMAAARKLNWLLKACDSGEWHHGQRSGQPLKNIVVLIPGPS